MRYNKKGQSALEFLTTYGWAFLVVLVMIGALSHFGVLSVPSVSKCTSEQGFGCESVVVTDKTQNFKFKNSLGTDVIISGASATIKSTGESLDCESSSSNVADGETFAIKCEGNLVTGKNENLDVSFKYYSPSGSEAYSKEIRASVSKRAENYEEYQSITQEEVKEFMKIIENYGGDSYCPQGFTHVPGNSYLGVGPFCVMTYEARQSGGNPVSTGVGNPWVSISFSNAITACQNAGHRLITNLEWLTIARNMEQVAYNWDSGVKGLGKMYRGNSDSGQMMASTSDLSGINRRKMYLSNGGEIWDLAGNAKEWVDLLENGASFNGGSCQSSDWFSFYENDGRPECQWSLGYSKSSSTDKRYELGSTNNYNANKGTGRVYSTATSGKILLRGGHFINNLDGGIFSADLGSSPHWSANSWGFRCTTNALN